MPSTPAGVPRLTGHNRHPHGPAPTCQPWPIPQDRSKRIESPDDRLHSPTGHQPEGTLPAAAHTPGRVVGPTISNHGTLDSHRLSVGSGTLLRQDAGSSPIIGNPSTRRKPPTDGFPAGLTQDNDTLYPRYSQHVLSDSLTLHKRTAMTVSTESTIRWCSALAGTSDSIPSLEECLENIPNLDTLDDLPSGTRVLVRGDTDVVVQADGSIPDDVRIRSLVDTLTHGGRRGWVQLVYGHRGRDPKMSLEPIARHLDTLLPPEVRGNHPVTFVKEWLDDQTGHVLATAADEVAGLPDGAIAVLENTRRYSLERALWKADDETIAEMAPRLTNYVNSVSDLLANVHVNEGFAASNRDLSSTLVPLGCQQVALGRYVDEELSRHVTRTRQADLVVFSGIKINKLDDLEQILARKQVKTVIAAGGLALALKAAAARHDGNEFGLGLAGDPTQAKIYIPPERIDQAGAMYRQGLEAGVEFVLPVDFVLGDGTASRVIPDGDAQFDVGPETRAVQVEAVGKFLDSHRMEVQAGRRPAIAFHNGVFGLFEEEAFEKGTREFVGQLKRMTDAGVEVYVGGGEGGTALARYGQPDWVTHCFTAGGTILKALGNEPIPYIKALYLKSLEAESRP